MKEPTAYKVVGRCEKTNRQVKKRVYTSFGDFNRYSPDLIKRYKRVYGIVEIYSLINEKWEMR